MPFYFFAMMRLPVGWGVGNDAPRNWGGCMAWVVDCRRNGLWAIWAGSAVGQRPP